MPRDSERAKSYRWEDDWIIPIDPRGAWRKTGRMTTAALLRLAARAFDRYRLIQTPQILPGRGASARLNRIYLTKSARCPTILLHEAAHCIVDLRTDLYADKPQGHGPEWRAVYCDLIAWHFKLDRTLVERTARSVGLTVHGGVAERWRREWRTPAMRAATRRRAAARIAAT